MPKSPEEIEAFIKLKDAEANFMDAVNHLPGDHIKEARKNVSDAVKLAIEERGLDQEE